MNILYVIHAPPWVEFSGAPHMLGQYIKAALSNGMNVAVLTRNLEGVYNNKNSSDYSKIQVYTYSIIDHWSMKAFDENEELIDKPLSLNGFNPDIVHIIDWVGLHPNILIKLKLLNVPIIRQILNFEDRCYFITPVRRLPNMETCSSPLSQNSCSDCILNHYSKNNNFLPSKIKNILKEFTPKYRQFKINIKKISDKRKETVEKQIEKYYDFLLFPSKSFADYFISHFDFKKPYEVIELGMTLPLIRPKRANKNFNPIKIIYAGGSSDIKGLNLLENTFLKILNENKFEFILKIYGVSKDRQKRSSLNDIENIKFIESYDVTKEPNIYEWADIGIAPTHFETFCRLVREYILNGVVPISTYAFGIPDIIENRKNGILINQPYQNSLYEAINELVENKVFLNTIRDNIHVTKIKSNEEEFNQLLNIYKLLIK
jgi:glycosyltransferase involved in cell wall biosynthesis